MFGGDNSIFRSLLNPSLGIILSFEQLLWNLVNLWTAKKQIYRGMQTFRSFFNVHVNMCGLNCVLTVCILHICNHVSFVTFCYKITYLLKLHVLQLLLIANFLPKYKMPFLKSLQSYFQFVWNISVHILCTKPKTTIFKKMTLIEHYSKLTFYQTTFILYFKFKCVKMFLRKFW